MQFSNEQVKSGKGKKKSRPLKTDDQKSEKDQNRIDNTQSSTSGNNSQESLWESFNAEDYQR